MCMSQLKVPQQVALTEFKGQVSAKVKVIIVTRAKMKIYYSPKKDLLPHLL